MPTAPAASRDRSLPSTSPPGRLSPRQTPQFVVFSSDDNFLQDGVDWLVQTFKSRTNPRGSSNPATFDGAPVRGTFFVIGSNQDYGNGLLESLRDAYRQGNEIGNHTFDHMGNLSLAAWLDQISRTNEWITRPVSQGGLGVPPSEAVGFRAPKTMYNTELFSALAQLGMLYDSSIVDGYQPGKDGTNEYWPYTLDEGSPAADWMYQSTFRLYRPPRPQPGLWELPLAVYRIPPDLQARYGKTAYGCDWNWVNHSHMMPEDMVSVFKYNLDLRLKSNRAPLVLCIHAEFFGYGTNATPEHMAQVDAMRNALAQMLDYSLSKPEVRVVRAIDVIRFMRKPAPLRQR